MTTGKFSLGNNRPVVLGGLLGAALLLPLAASAWAQASPPAARAAPAQNVAPAPAVPPQAAPAPAADASAGPSAAQQAAPAAPAVPPQAAAIPTMPPQPPPVTPPAEKRGFLNGFGAWWDKSVADFKAKMKEQQTELDDFNKKSAEAMKSAADAMGRLRASKIVEIQQVCPKAGNGAPDCATAAVDACKAKGFKDGQPLDIRTAEKCTASLWVSGQAQTPADCPVETVLLRVACQ